MNDELWEAYTRLEIIEESYQKRRDRGEFVYEPNYKEFRKKGLETIRDVVNKLLSVG